VQRKSPKGANVFTLTALYLHATWRTHMGLMSDATIVRLYEALNRHDGEAAAACYTADAVFEDPAFGRLTGGQVRHMWKMLAARSHDLVVELHDHGAEGDSGWARWSATYTFSPTGNHVVNDIEARFRFTASDLIAEHVDSFPLRRWGRQALGRKGTVLGATGLLGPVVRRQARAGLAAHVSGGVDGQH
jgi:ketosteroid isomerase-like protein